MSPKPPDILRKSHRHTEGKERATAKEDLKRQVSAIETAQGHQARYSGACHCQAVSYVYSTDLPVTDWPVRACQCSFCRSHGAVCTSDPLGSVEFSAKEPPGVNRYRFGQNTADFLICRQCGVYVGAVITTAGGTYGIVNLDALSETPAGLPAPEPVSYEGEAAGSRCSRREERWTPAVMK